MKQLNVVLVLKTGGDFHYSDVTLLADHILKQTPSANIMCLHSNIKEPTKMSNVLLLPMENPLLPRWWGKMNMFSPSMDQYRPFLYMDLDTAVVGTLEDILPPLKNEKEFICMGDFLQLERSNRLQSGLMWFPEREKNTEAIWQAWCNESEGIMERHFSGGDQEFFREVLPLYNTFWQHFTNKICSFKENSYKGWLPEVANYISIVCFHGVPRIPIASRTVKWVNDYFNDCK